MELAAPKDNSQPKRLLPPAGEEAVRRSLTDGGGDCKAMGTVDFFPGGDTRPEAAHRPAQAPSVACSDSSLQRKEPWGINFGSQLPLQKEPFGSLTPPYKKAIRPLCRVYGFDC